MTRLAVVLFNLGGPDGPDAVRPFLFNLFRDKAIIGAPAPVRYPLAAFISATRAKGARANYALMGGGSPLLPETRKQAEALQAELSRQRPGDEVRVFVSMRYWKPFAAQTAREVTEFAPDEVVLLPLYPQFSTTTTESSIKDWSKAYQGPGRSRTVCCYPVSDGLAEAHARAIRGVWEAAGRPAGLRLLFSAHGLPERVVAGGDPYQAQVEATAAAVAAHLPEFTDWKISYQSRVGPLKWIGPSTDDEIRLAGAEGVGVIVSPIAFVSEHVETLVELDHEYAELAHEAGCPVWLRAPAPGTDPSFISALAGAVGTALEREGGVAPDGNWSCAAVHGRCPCLEKTAGARR
ncbi:MAG: ferrochelatase [Phenylobacterium sp.]|uniref:ferrochelatase n=1 Tax=Phenylobacterium sp. TaxID=1871053 RepID=UPI0025F55F22|nr:ferrochelatase [Phenylobacterium sp.]MCA6298285.1 ferrochelatase [Phenylobacterium sp.]